MKQQGWTSNPTTVLAVEVSLIVVLGALQLYVLYSVCSRVYQAGKAEIVPM